MYPFSFSADPNPCQGQDRAPEDHLTIDFSSEQTLKSILFMGEEISPYLFLVPHLGPTSWRGAVSEEASFKAKQACTGFAAIIYIFLSSGWSWYMMRTPSVFSARYS